MLLLPHEFQQHLQHGRKIVCFFYEGGGSKQASSTRSCTVQLRRLRSSCRYVGKTDRRSVLKGPRVSMRTDPFHESSRSQGGKKLPYALQSATKSIMYMLLLCVAFWLTGMWVMPTNRPGYRLFSDQGHCYTCVHVLQSPAQSLHTFPSRTSQGGTTTARGPRQDLPCAHCEPPPHCISLPAYACLLVGKTGGEAVANAGGCSCLCVMDLPLLLLVK